MFKEQLLVSVLCLSLIVKFKLKLYFIFFYLIHQFPKSKNHLPNLNQIFIFDFFFTFSYSLLIVLNRLGLFNIIPSHDDKNRAVFFNRACYFRYLNRINPSFAMF